MLHEFFIGNSEEPDLFARETELGGIALILGWVVNGAVLAKMTSSRTDWGRLLLSNWLRIVPANPIEGDTETLIYLHK
jgi:hypothetical protein